MTGREPNPPKHEVMDRESNSKATEGEGAEQETADGKLGIFIRLSPESKRTLENAKQVMGKAQAGQRTYAGVIERLLEYYKRQESHFKEKILAGDITNPLKESEDLLAMLHRAQHAFETKRFYFAIKTYNAIAKRLDSGDSSDDLLDVCRFRLAHCWNLLSYRLRGEALSDEPRLDLKDKSGKLYDLALRAVMKAVSYLDKLPDDGDELMRLIKHFNMACCYSLEAQYIVESKLSPEHPLCTPLHNAGQDRKKMDDLWANSIGKVWSDLDADASAQKAASMAFDWLAKIGPKTDETSGHAKSLADSKLKSESIWIVNEAREDPDFLFLRTAKGWKEDFDKWESVSLEGASIATAIEDLLDESHVL
ncbi:MAG TPA: hypothetical protein VNO50_05400 [Pyrinomonadaceae bacterium]|nr:hypothetical protein [Pyrinomonadaceae bacterium]